MGFIEILWSLYILVIYNAFILRFSVAFGMRKALQAEQGKADMEQKVSSYLYLVCNVSSVL
jgi:hypothetical protein